MRRSETNEILKTAQSDPAKIVCYTYISRDIFLSGWATESIKRQQQGLIDGAAAN